MATAAVIFCEETRQAFAKTRARQELHASLDGMVLAIDGAFVPTRPERAKGEAAGRRRTWAKRAGWQGEWQEAKGCRFSLVDKERIGHLLS